MKAAIYTLIGLGVIGAISYMLYQSMHPKAFIPTKQFDKDDEYLYNLMRADMQNWSKKYMNGDVSSWLDDIVRGYYDSSYIAGHQSKSAAYVEAVNAQDALSSKRDFYNALLNNLRTKYENK